MVNRLSTSTATELVSHSIYIVVTCSFNRQDQNILPSFSIVYINTRCLQIIIICSQIISIYTCFRQSMNTDRFLKQRNVLNTKAILNRIPILKLFYARSLSKKKHDFELQNYSVVH